MTAEADAVARLLACNFRGAAKRLDDVDLPKLGHLIGVGEDEIHAFIDVETSGGGFETQGRPKALYEPHRAYALSSGAARAKLVAQGLAYPKWGEKPYPSDSYPRITAAMAIDARVALEATSWGLGQVLGSNHVAAGHESAAEMVAACLDDEENHLAQAIGFIKANRLDDELRTHNWAAFARGYNGPQYAANKYDTRLAAAYARWAKIKDTPWAPGQPDIGGLQAIAVGQSTRPADAILTTRPAPIVVTAPATIVQASPAAPVKVVPPTPAVPPGRPTFLARLLAWANRPAA